MVSWGLVLVATRRERKPQESGEKKEANAVVSAVPTSINSTVDKYYLGKRQGSQEGVGE